MIVNRLELLNFYDNPPKTLRGLHAAAVNAVAGEELGLALLVEYLKATEPKTCLLQQTCNQGTKSGSRLDGWIHHGKILYQVEVKNWSSNSIGGKPLPIEVDQAAARKYRIDRWKEVWDGNTFKSAKVSKVLTRMKTPNGREEEVEPLVVFWTSMHPRGDNLPMFSLTLKNHHFKKVSVFSMSSYLRKLNVDIIRLDLPKTEERIGILSSMFC